MQSSDVVRFHASGKLAGRGVWQRSIFGRWRRRFLPLSSPQEEPCHSGSPTPAFCGVGAGSGSAVWGNAGKQSTPAQAPTPKSLSLVPFCGLGGRAFGCPFCWCGLAPKDSFYFGEAQRAAARKHGTPLAQDPVNCGLLLVPWRGRNGTRDAGNTDACRSAAKLPLRTMSNDSITSL